MRRLTIAAAIAVAAALATVLLHGRTLGYGFDYDDYHFIRPYTSSDVAAAFRGPWDASRIEIPYYRPLTIAFFAARFELLGVNSVAHHALSLILFASAAFLIGWFAFRLTGHAAGAVAAPLLVAHPAVPYSLVAWVTNQMHLLQTLVVLAAFTWWHAVRRKRALWWFPLLPLGACAFLLKEDGIMLLPAIAALHIVQRRLSERDLPRLSWVFVAASAVLLAMLLYVRSDALDASGGRPVPAFDAAMRNYGSGLYRVFCLAPADRPWQRAASWFVIALPIAALAAWRRASGGPRAAFAAGAAIALLFDLPFIFVTKAEQLHMIAAGAVIALAASVVIITETMRARAARTAVLAAVAAGLALLSAVTIDIERDFEPFGPLVLGHDAIVREWAAVPGELRGYLEAKRAPGAAQRLSPNPADALERITFGVHGRESSGGVPFQWMAGRRVELLLSRDTHAVTIPIRHAIEIVRQPAQVTITAEGRVVDRMDLTTPEWRVSRIPAPVGRVSRWFRMYRLTIETGNVWNPSKAIAGSTDDRTLGLQIGEIAITHAGFRR